jgi:hypothetical protein
VMKILYVYIDEQYCNETRLPFQHHRLAYPGQEAGLAASGGLSESKLLGLLIDSMLERNPFDEASEERHGEAEEGDRITLRLRPGDRKWRRLRAHARGMKYTTYAEELQRCRLAPEEKKVKLLATRDGIVEDWGTSAILLRAQGHESLAQAVEAYVRRMATVATEKKIVAKGLLAQVAAQRSRVRFVGREQSVGDRAR